jgi:hypothetical protein
MITITVVHGWRILRQWLRGPRFWLTAIAFPLLYAGVVNLLFGALVRQFTGDFDPADATILVAVSWAFMLCIMGSVIRCPSATAASTNGSRRCPHRTPLRSQVGSSSSSCASSS